MTQLYSCGTCKIEIKNEDESVQCDLCDRWNHIFCAGISSAECDNLNFASCRGIVQYVQKKIPFPSLSNKELNIFLSRNSSHHSAQVISTKEILNKLMNLHQFFDHSENAVSCDYLGINEYKRIEIKGLELSLLHLYISPL